MLMLTKIMVENFKSFDGQTELTMVSSSKIRTKSDHRIKIGSNTRLLKHAVIYGANASGKSNLVDFMRFLKSTVKMGLPVWSTKYFCRNNKENDYLTLKYARKNDLWFHTKDIHGSHAILILNNVNSSLSDEVLTKCAEIAAFHSKARLSSNVPVDFCEVRFVKKPNGAKPGMVIYTNNSTLYVTPKIIKY